MLCFARVVRPVLRQAVDVCNGASPMMSPCEERLHTTTASPLSFRLPDREVFRCRGASLVRRFAMEVSRCRGASRRRLGAPLSGRCRVSARLQWRCMHTASSVVSATPAPAPPAVAASQAGSAACEAASARRDSGQTDDVMMTSLFGPSEGDEMTHCVKYASPGKARCGGLATWSMALNIFDRPPPSPTYNLA